MQSAGKLYEQNISSYKALLVANKRKSNLASLFRLVSFLIFSGSIYACFSSFNYDWLASSVLFGLLFLVLVRVSFRLKDQRLLYEKLVLINTNELNVLRNDPSFFDDGRSFQSEMSYLGDLDIFGSGSLYHLLNRATTSHGKQSLAYALQDSFYQKSEIESVQDALRTLSGQVQKRQMITALGMLYEEKEENLRDVYSWLEIQTKLTGRLPVRILRWTLPALSLSAAYYYLASDHILPLTLFISANWILTGYFLRYINRQHGLLSKKQQILDQYTAILRSFCDLETGSSATLERMKGSCTEAHRSIQHLSRLSQLFDQRLNLLVNILMNSFLLYDLQCTVELEKWKEKNKTKLPDWYRSVGNIECLNSLASFAFNNPGYAYPVVTEETISITATQIAHPLIPGKERIANDIVIGKEDQVHLITGSNMSGKTTFLRTLGVNMILAQCGAPVCAATLVFRPMKILSSVRISDSLHDHTSYFMAELERLQEIIQCLEEKQPALVLIDEILRGTNSEDKTHGSEKFIQKLLNYPCLSLFATHDLTLGKMEKLFPGKIRNYCFESEIRHEELYFDYSLRSGIAKNKNASFLMDKMGIT